jgi:flagellar protein FliO/FliZ
MNSPAAGSEAVLGLATFGKTAAALALVIAVIFLCAALVRRIGPGRQGRGQILRVVSSAAVGTRERVVVVEIDSTWLVLGVASGQVNTLHTLPAPADDGAGSAAAPDVEAGFPARLAQALKHNAGKTLGRSGDKV